MLKTFFQAFLLYALTGVILCLQNNSVIAKSKMPLQVPGISVNPAAINVTVPCTNSVTVPLTITNTGTSNLNYNINISGIGNPNDTAILVIADASSFGFYTEEWINQQYGITPTLITSSQIPSTNFALYDIVVTVSGQNSNYYANIDAAIAQFSNFVYYGGILISQSSLYAGTVNLPGGAVANCNLSSEMTNLGVLFSHPILDGMYNPITGNFASTGSITNIPANADTITIGYISNLPTTIEYFFGIGKVIATTMPWEWGQMAVSYTMHPLLLNAWNYAFNELINNSSWIQVNNSSGILLPGDSTVVQVTINASILSVGNYTENLSISSNSPTNPVINVPVNLTVTGSPIMSLSNNCAVFGTISQYTSSTDTLAITNTGCDTLIISSATPSLPQYSVAGIPMQIAPGASQNLVVTFSPTTVGNFNGNIMLANNVGNSSICVTGTATAAPDIIVNPSVINYTINCIDSGSVPLYISNAGGNNLIYNIDNSLLGTGGAIQVLAVTHGVDLNGDYANTINGINQYFTNYQVTQLNTTNPTLLQAALAGKHILLFPEQESGSTGHYLSLAPVVQNFVSNGGTVIVCGTYHAPAAIYNMGLFTGNYIDGVDFGSGTVSDTTDYLVKGINLLSFPLPSATFYHNITNPDKMEVVSYLGNDVVTYRNIGSGRAIYIAWDYYEYNSYTQRIIANAIRGGFNFWINLDSTVGMVTPGGTDTIIVSFNSINLPIGNYTTNITISSNDPLNPNQIVPINLTVSGPPEMNLSASCLNFGTITQYTTAVDTLTISNHGCDTLHITSANPSLAQYSISGLPLHIPLGGSSDLIVNFNPTTVGTFNGSLLILNNDSNQTICLTGSASPSALILANPVSINYSLNCGDSGSVPLTVYNTGGSDLNFNTTYISSEGGGIKQILALTYGVYTNDYINTINAINQFFTNYAVTQLNTTIDTTLQAALNGIDVLLFPDQQSLSGAHYVSFAPVVQNFVNNGGTVIVCGNYNYPNSMYDMGLFTGNYINYFTSGLATVLDTTDGLVEGINQSSFPFVETTFYHNITNTDKVEVVAYNGNDVVTYRNIGSGRAIYIGWDYAQFNTSTQHIIANAVKGSGTGWLSASSNSGIIPPGDSTVIIVNLNTNGLNSGTFNSSITISSNDPLNPLLNVPVTLNVSGTPSINLSTSCLQFGQIQQFTSLTDTLILLNTGCDTLLIDSLNTNNPQFTVTASSMVIAADSALMVYVTYTPTALGASNGTLYINNNDQDSSICLSGQAFVSPLIDLPSSIDVSVSPCTDSVITSFYIKNTGGGTLNWVANNVRILAMTYGVDLIEEYPRTIASIEQYFTNYTINTTTTISASVLQPLLQNADVLLFPEQEYLFVTHYWDLASVVQNFINNGGTVIICGSANTLNRPFDLGLFTGNYVSAMNSGTATINDTSNFLVAGISGSTLSCAATTFRYNFTNADKFEIVSLGGYDIVTYRNIGAGKAIYIGFDYFAFNASTQQIIANAVESSTVGSNPTLITMTPLAGNTSEGDSTLAYMVIHTDTMSGGIYNQYFMISSNDPLHPIDSILVTMNISSIPCAFYNFEVPSQCEGNVIFTDNSSNNPTSWQWDFGDGTFSTLANPSHLYTSTGNFLVKLIVCNSFGCDSITQTITIFSLNGPVASSCNTNTTAYCCGLGITGVTLNTMNNISIDASAGYEDFTCNGGTTLIAGNTYQLTVTTGTNVYNENVRAWINYNNNGTFDIATEQIMSTNNVNTSHIASFTVPLSAVTGVPLRLRIADDYFSNPAPQPCASVTNGQIEDYSIVIVPNNFPPTANFNHIVTNPCTYQVQFNNLSGSGVTSYYWDFGDGNNSILQNPTHQYGASGTYVVWLYASNAFGTDSVSNFVTINPFIPSFTITGTTLVGFPINFNCIPSGGTSFLWDFGDSNQSTLQNPQHTYLNAGTFVISLIIDNGVCADTLYETLTITNVVSMKEQDLSLYFNAYPNPFKDDIQITYELQKQSQVSLEAIDLIGQVVYSFENNISQAEGQYIYTFKPETAGIYFIQLSLNGKRNLIKIVKVN